MNVAAPQTRLLLWTYRAYVAAFFIYLAAPLAAASVFAFNDSLFPQLPWRGFTLAWFFNDTEPKLGMFHDRRIMQSLANSFYIGAIVVCPLGRGRNLERLSLRAKTVSRKGGALHPDDHPARHSRRDSRYLDPGLCQHHRELAWRTRSAST